MKISSGIFTGTESLSTGGSSSLWQLQQKISYPDQIRELARSLEMYLIGHIFILSTKRFACHACPTSNRPDRAHNIKQSCRVNAHEHAWVKLGKHVFHRARLFFNPHTWMLDRTDHARSCWLLPLWRAKAYVNASYQSRNDRFLFPVLQNCFRL